MYCYEDQEEGVIYSASVVREAFTEGFYLS